MKIHYIKEYGCCFIEKDEETFYFANFDSNKIIKVANSTKNISGELTKETFDFLKDEGVIADKKYGFYPKGKYKPTSATFLMTSRCNLKCVYCYAFNNYEKDLSFSSARSVINYLIENAITRQKEAISVRFHGLGEPTQCFSVLKAVVEYAKVECTKRHLKVIFHITTNGIMNDEQRAFIIKHMEHITVSMDGMELYQNKQRPLLGGNSFTEALKTLDAIPNKDRLIVRTTVTNLNLDGLEEWCIFLKEHGIKNLCIEPVSVCGNCENTNITDLDHAFSQIYIRICEKFPQLNIMYSCFWHSKRPYHCGAFGSNMVVTPFDTISTCYECYDENDIAQELFVIGKVTSAEVCIDENKLQKLKQKCFMLRTECSSCFAQTFCNGSCLSKRYKASIEKGNSYSIVSNKCSITKKIIMEALCKRLDSEISSLHAEELFS